MSKDSQHKPEDERPIYKKIPDTDDDDPFHLDANKYNPAFDNPFGPSYLGEPDDRNVPPKPWVKPEDRK